MKISDIWDYKDISWKDLFGKYDKNRNPPKNQDFGYLTDLFKIFHIHFNFFTGKLARLLVVLQCCHLWKPSFAKLTCIRFLPSMWPHVPLNHNFIIMYIIRTVTIDYLKTGSFEKSFRTLWAEVSSLIVVLFPVENCRVPVCEFSPTIFTLKQRLKMWDNQ